MKENIVKNKSFAFAIRIVKLYQYLCKEKHEYVLSKQILKSGTSIELTLKRLTEEFQSLIFPIKFQLHIKNPKEHIIGLGY